MASYEFEGEDLLFYCYLQPKASRSEIVGLHDGLIKVRIAAPPVDGKANATLIKFLASYFGTAAKTVNITSGQHSRRKRIRITGPVLLPEEFKSLFS
ncbi:MAG: YggU family protein [Gammaproteobacteria bacterium]|nr:YggU family protein [Gammaproteobacteria bacterium]